MKLIFKLAMAAVILGHFFFAYKQWFDWTALCERLTGLEPGKCADFEFLGRSIASYNASIGLGLLASFRLDEVPRSWVQGVTLALIVVTAAVGAAGTGSIVILIARLLPAALALGLLIYINKNSADVS